MYTRKMNLNDTLVNHVPMQQAAMEHANAYGIEVELEGKHIMEPPMDVQTYWKQHNDGSLRKLNPGDQCCEYISRAPYPMQTTEKSIQALFAWLNSPQQTVYDSYRTSIHVHVNFGQEKFRTIYNFMTLALILDELLTSQNGKHRIGNNFCLRAKDALGQVVQLVQSIESGHQFFNLQAHDRYSSINFASLLKFGSIEFRSLECTIHEGRVMHWIGTLAHMKEQSKLFENPTDVIRQFSQKGPRGFLMSVLGPFALKYLSVPGWDDMLQNGMRIAQDLAFCSSWNEGTECNR